MITYKYIDAYRPDGTKKDGVIRISYVNGNEITREYMESDPRTQPSAALQAVLNATPEEIAQIKSILGIQ